MFMLPDLCSAGECRCSRNVNDFNIETEQTTPLAFGLSRSSRRQFLVVVETLCGQKVTNNVTGNRLGFRPAALRPTGHIFQADAAAIGN